MSKDLLPRCREVETPVRTLVCALHPELTAVLVRGVRILRCATEPWYYGLFSNASGRPPWYRELGRIWLAPNNVALRGREYLERRYLRTKSASARGSTGSVSPHHWAYREGMDDGDGPGLPQMRHDAGHCEIESGSAFTLGKRCCETLMINISYTQTYTSSARRAFCAPIRVSPSSIVLIKASSCQSIHPPYLPSWV